MGSILAFSHFFHRRQNTRREDGTVWEFGYNDRSEVTSAVKQAANSQLVPGQSFAYGFDAMGNRTSTSAGTAPNVATSGYTPNALNQFSSITTPGKFDVLARSDSPASFQIDGQNVPLTSVGNLHNAHANVANSPNGKHVSVSVTANGSTQSGSRWLAPASVVPSYDADGNLKQDGRWSYTWDGENRLTKLETLTSAITAGAPNLTISYTYDFRSRKLRETLHDGATLTQDERTLYDGWNPVAEFSSPNLQSPISHVRSFTWGVDLSGTTQGAGGVGGLLAVRSSTPVSGSSVFFPSYDTNGNIIAWSNESGQLIRRLDYDPFGNVVMKESFQGSTAELDQVLKHGFSTKPQNPESGLLYYGYRFYDPQLGRWLNRDPIEEAGGINLYGFVGNNCNNKIDILGLRHCTSKRIDINLGKKEFRVGNGKLTFKLQIRGTAQACNDCTKTLSASITGAVGSDIPVVAPFIVTVSGNVNGEVTATFDGANNNSDIFGDLSVQGWVGGGVSGGVAKVVGEGGFSLNWDISGDFDENQVSIDIKGKDIDFNARLRVTVGFGSWEYNAIPYQFATRVGTPPNFSASIALPGFP